LEETTAAIDLSGVFGPIPEVVKLKQLPGWAWFDRAAGDPDPPPEIFVRLRAEWSPSQEVYLLGDADNVVALASSQATANSFALEQVFNARPEDLVLHYEFGANLADVGRIASLHLRLELPFAFQTTPFTPPGEFLDFEDESGNNPLVMEEDIFGRDPAEPDEDLDQLLESLRGGNATIFLQLVNTSGLGARLGILNSADPSLDRTNPADWLIDVELEPVETEQEIRVDLTAQVLDQLIDGAGANGEFIPEFLIVLPEEFQINSIWEFSITEGWLRVQANVDYSFSLADDE